MDQEEVDFKLSDSSPGSNYNHIDEAPKPQGQTAREVYNCTDESKVPVYNCTGESQGPWGPLPKPGTLIGTLKMEKKLINFSESLQYL